MLSWLVDGQLVAKRGNLIQIGGQEGTKLKLRGALGRPKRVYNGTTPIEYAANVLELVSVMGVLGPP